MRCIYKTCRNSVILSTNCHGMRLNAFCGFFIDVNPNDTACSVEEIYLEAEKDDLYLQCLPQFEECLHSIEWLAK